MMLACFQISRWVVACLVSLVVANSGTAQAQKKAVSPPPVVNEEIEKVEFITYQLKHARAEKIAEVLGETIGGCKSVADSGSNSIIVVATAPTQKIVGGLIEKLDIAKPSVVNSLKLKTLAIPPSVSDEVMMQALQRIVPSNNSDRYTLDPARKQLLVYANDDTTKLMAELLDKLSAGHAQPPQERDVTIRLVCLVDGFDPKTEQKMPEDFDAVRKTLAKFGIAKPIVVAQTLVHVSPGASFETQGNVMVEAGIRFTVSGQFRYKGDAASLSISIREAKLAADGKTFEVNNMKTDITAPFGQFILLGMTPNANMTKIYAVQVIAGGG